jgi:hypothetical protein
MPNLHYQAGRRQEYVVKRKYERGGAWTMRAAGSKGEWDIIALRRDTPDVCLIQVKRVKLPAEAKRMIAAFRKHPPDPEPYRRILEIYITTTRETLTTEV